MRLGHTYKQDFEYILTLITEARNSAYSKANSELILLYFNVGRFVGEKVHSGNWGENTVQQLADFIKSKAPNLSGFNRRGLYRMKQFYEVYSDNQFVSTVTALLQDVENQLNEFVSAVPTLLSSPMAFQQKFLENILAKITWTNHLEILSGTKTGEEKVFYLLGCLTEKWGMRELRRQIQTATYERTMLSKPIVSPPVEQLPENLFKNPYIFEFLDLPDHHSEKDLEKAIALNLQKFILEVGKGFTYMGEQYRISDRIRHGTKHKSCNSCRIRNEIDRQKIIGRQITPLSASIGQNREQRPNLAPEKHGHFIFQDKHTKSRVED